jgi:predicted nucleic acid-binding protein
MTSLPMTPLVVDASAFIDAMLQSTRGRRVADVLARGSWHVPAHFDAEVFGVVVRMYRRGHIDVDRRDRMLGALAAAAVVRHATHELIRDASGRTDTLSGADALYASLASALDANLVTCDRGLASQVPGAILIS